MMKKIVSLVVVGILLSGCMHQGNIGQNLGSGNDQAAVQPGENGGGGQEKSTEGLYEDFTIAGFKAAKAANKTIVVYFEANWCPICRAQKPVNEEAFSEYTSDDGVAIFVSNFNDSEESDDDREIQRELGISYQHTFVFFAPGETESYRFTGRMTKEEILDRIEEARGK